MQEHTTAALRKVWAPHRHIHIDQGATLKHLPSWAGAYPFIFGIPIAFLREQARLPWMSKEASAEFKSAA